MITPDFVGQVYKDTLTGNIWRANSLTPGDWTLELKNNISFVPVTYDIGSALFLGSYQGAAGLTEMMVAVVGAVEGIDLEDMVDIQVINCPFLTTVGSGGILIKNCTSATSILFPVLVSGAVGGIAIENCAALSISFPSLTSSTNLTVHLSPSLASISIPVFLPTNTRNYGFDGNALTDVSVNHILARFAANAGYVSGILNLSGGTNAAPSGQGIADKATLIGRGVTVATN